MEKLNEFYDQKHKQNYDHYVKHKKPFSEINKLL